MPELGAEKSKGGEQQLDCIEEALMEQPKGENRESSREVRSEPGKRRRQEPPREPETPESAEEDQAKRCTRKRQKQVIRKPQASYEQESGEEPEAELSHRQCQQLSAPEQGPRPRHKLQEVLHEPDSEGEANTQIELQEEPGEEEVAEQVSPRARSKSLEACKRRGSCDR